MQSGALLGALGACACGGETGGAPGIDVEEHTADLVLELAVGEDPGAPAEYLFASIYEIVLAPDGTLWVLDANQDAFAPSPKVRRYGAEGTFLGAVGGEGDGPGEYRSPNGLSLLPDGRVALRDGWRRERLTLYAADGSLESVVPLDRNLYWMTAGSGGVDADSAGTLRLPFHSTRPGPDRPPPLLLRIRPDGSVVDTVPWPPVTLPEVERVQLRVVRDGGRSTRGFSVPWQPRAVWAMGSFGECAVASTDRYRVEILDCPGPADRPPRAVTRDVAPVPVPEAEREAARRGLEADIAAVEGAGHLDVPDMPTRKPLLTGLRFADDGRLLVGVSMPSRLEDGEWTEPTGYDVFDRGGGFVGRIELPPAFFMFGLTGDRLWGRVRDDLGVESVRVYRVVWR